MKNKKNTIPSSKVALHVNVIGPESILVLQTSEVINFEVMEKEQIKFNKILPSQTAKDFVITPVSAFYYPEETISIFSP